MTLVPRGSKTRCGILIAAKGRRKIVRRVRNITWTTDEHLVTCRQCSPWLT